MTGSLLEVKSVSRAFGKVRAVDELSFALERGQIFGFIGPNGSGKTTTMRILATLDLPDAGDAYVEGTSVLVDPRGVRMKLGFMSDQFHPYPNLDVLQFLDFFARAYGLVGDARVRTVGAVAEFCGLGEFLDRPVTGLSKGMGQRVHLAKTLLHDPSLLILDEPASGLDPRARIEFRELLKALAARGKGILISSHILAELSEICHGAVVIERGQRVASGSLDQMARSVSEHMTVQVRVIGDQEAAARWFATQPHVADAATSDGWVTFQFTAGEGEKAEILRHALLQGIAVVEFRTAETDLEEIFLRTTQGRLQ